MTSKPSLVFFGNEKLATGIGEPEPVILNSLRQAGYGIEAVIKERMKIASHYKSNLAVLAAFGRIVPQTVIDQFPLGIINIHPSLLPIYRGPTPIEQAILEGVTKTGVSIMKLEAKMDAGPIYAQVELELSGAEAKTELARQLQQLGADALTDVLDAIFDKTAQPKPQIDSEASYCSKITKSDGIIDWAKPATQLEREIRAYLGWPSSRATLLDAEVIITDALVTDFKGEPGKVTKTDQKELMVACGQDALIIDRLKPAGKREMTGPEFLAGHPL